MNIVKGTVNSIGTKQVTGFKGRISNTYSIKVDGEWFSCGFKHPGVAENDYIQFMWEANGNFKNVDVSSIKKFDTAPATSKAPDVASATKGATMTKDEYWLRKEERDVETQQRIQLQAARNAAIAVVDTLIVAGAVKLPAAQGKKYDAMLALIDELTAKYFNDTTEMYVATTGATFDEEEIAE